MKPRVVRLGLVQMSASAHKSDNIAKALDRVREARARGAEIVCLPELFATEYFCQTEDPALIDLAEAVPGPTTLAMSRVAEETGAVVIVSIFEKRAPGIYHNSLVTIGVRGETLGIYRKMHIPHDPLFFEKYYFTPGDLGFNAFETPFAKVGTLICWDQWYPEGARLTALRGAEL